MGILSTSLTTVIVMVFVVNGIMKLSPALSAEGHAMKIAESHYWIQLPPLKFFRTADILRTVFGGGEVLCGLLLVTPLHMVANLGIVGYLIWETCIRLEYAGYVPIDLAFGIDFTLLLLVIVRLFVVVGSTEDVVVRRKTKRDNDKHVIAPIPLALRAVQQHPRR